MKYDKELIDIITKKEFKTFWHCLDYLLLAGYTPIDAFGISIKQFGEDKIFSSVAFARIDIPRHSLSNFGGTYTSPKPILIVGLIDESNIHLDGVYSVYRKAINEGLFGPFILDIEDTCELIKTSTLSEFILTYLMGVSEKHFGYVLFHIPKRNNLEINIPNDEYRQRMLGGMGIPRNRFDISVNTPHDPQNIDIQQFMQNQRNRE